MNELDKIIKEQLKERANLILRLQSERDQLARENEKLKAECASFARRPARRRSLKPKKQKRK